MTQRPYYRHLHHALCMLLDHGVETVDRVGSPYTKERLCDLIRSDARDVKCYLTDVGRERLAALSVLGGPLPVIPPES